MMPTLIFTAICAAIFASPFIWHARRKRKRTNAALAADAATLMIEIEQHLNRRDH